MDTLEKILEKIGKVGDTVDQVSERGIPFEVSLEPNTLTTTAAYLVGVFVLAAVAFGFAYYVANKALGK